MEAGKFCDLWGCLPGHTMQSADGNQAYCQSSLKETRKTWIRLPPHKWPPSWRGPFHDPVVPLHRALYGHPDAGGFWEQHCEDKVAEAGFKPVGGCYEWRSCFWNSTTRMLLSIYVDDFKLAGPEDNMAQTWADLRGKRLSDGS